MSAIAGKISRYFQLEKFGTSITTEILAGLSTYLSLAYIFIVNPAILSGAGIDPKSALFATAVVASLATLAMGLWANLPFAVAPGLTMNSYFVFVVCKKMHLSWQQGLATVFVSGVICVLLTALPVRQSIIDSLPKGLKSAIAVTIGIFVATIGLFISKMISFTPSGFIDLYALHVENFTSSLALVLGAGLVTSMVLGLKRFHFPASMIVAIIVSSLLYHKLLGNGSAPPVGEGNVLASFAKLDFSVFFHSSFWVPVIVFFVLNFFEGIGEFIGLTANTSIQDKDGNVPNMKQALWIDGLGTMGAAVFGTSSLIVFVESAVGIKAGGRTGLTAVVCSLLMILCVFAGFYCSDVLAFFPAQAVSGVLVYVGYLIFSGSVDGKNGAAFDHAVALLMSLISFLTFSLDKPLAFGMWAYFCLSIARKKPSWWLGGIAAALTAAILCSA